MHIMIMELLSHFFFFFGREIWYFINRNWRTTVSTWTTKKHDKFNILPCQLKGDVVASLALHLPMSEILQNP